MHNGITPIKHNAFSVPCEPRQVKYKQTIDWLRGKRPGTICRLKRRRWRTEGNTLAGNPLNSRLFYWLVVNDAL